MGYTLEVLTNSYEITRLPQQPYYHFDEISPAAISKSRNAEIIDRLQADTAAPFSSRPVYDGRKNMFCLRDIPSGCYSVCMGRRGKIPQETHKVFIRRVSIINPEHVKQLTRPRDRNDSTVSNGMPLTLLQLIIRQAPNIRHGFPAHTNRFLLTSGALDLRCGLSAWKGFFQSVRPTMDRLLVNIDVSHAAVYTPGPLFDVMMQYLGLKNVRDLQNLTDQELVRLKHFLKRVRVSVAVSKNMRARPITDLIRAAGLQEFDKDGERITVQNHFETKYGVTVRYPQHVGVRIGKSAIIPGELCRIAPGQVYRKQLSPDAQRSFLKFATQKPQDRLNAIQGAISDGLFNYTDSDYMKDAGMVVSQHPVSVPGQVIDPPEVWFKNGKTPIPAKSGSWNVVDKVFWQPATLQSWAVIVFDGSHIEREVKPFICALVHNMQKLGMTLKDTRPQIFTGNPSNPEDVLQRAGDALYQTLKVPPQLFLVLLPANAADCRRAVKHWGDSKKKVSTQCLRRGKWDQSRGRDQYCNNVALKVNTRLGGVNSVVRSPLTPMFRDSMIIGADVGHPGPGVTDRPSITGLVASVDSEGVHTTSSVSVQDPRVEIIQDLEHMVVDALTMWRSWHETWMKDDPASTIPRNIIFYRDGVSEGEYAQVVQSEIPMIKSAFAKMGLDSSRHPKLLFLVVGKRHHVRFFPKTPHEADKSGNCPAGLLVDCEKLNNPNYSDFYLQSHAPILGTGRPAHYVVLKNETRLDKQMIEHLTFHLCHLYSSATRSVSIPAPVYDADKICQRLDIHCEIDPSLSDTASSTSGTSASFDVAEWKERYKFRPSLLNNRKGYQ